MDAACRKFYFIALGILLALSAYPVAMGLRIVVIELMRGGITPGDYARYIVPYTAVCLSALIVAALFPLLSRIGRHAAAAATALALGLFVGVELYMESITIYSETFMNAVTMQLTMCAYTPSAVATYSFQYTEAFKIHYFLISFVCISLVVSVFYGYGAYFSGARRGGVLPLRLQLAAAALFVALCVFANFTSFYRERTEILSPLSAALTFLYFIVLGVSAGIWLGSLLVGRRNLVSVWLPAAFASAVCAVMYYGEYRLLGGTLYRFGETFLFKGTPAIALAPADMAVILMAGVATGFIMARAGRTAQTAGDGARKDASPARL